MVILFIEGSEHRDPETELRILLCCYPGSSTRSVEMFVLSAGTFQVSLDNRLFQV